MIRTQIYLTEEERSGVARLAQASGKKQSEVIRQAIDELLQKGGSSNKLARLRKAKGIWKNRRKPDLAAMRKKFDRF